MTSIANPWDEAKKEVTGLFEALSSYSKQLSDSSMGVGPHPDLAKVLEKVSLPHLSDLADRMATAAASLARGSMSDTVILAASVAREAEMVNMDKGEVLMAGNSDAQLDAQASKVSGLKTSAAINGQLPQQR